MALDKPHEVPALREGVLQRVVGQQAVAREVPGTTGPQGRNEIKKIGHIFLSVPKPQKGYKLRRGPNKRNTQYSAKRRP